MPVRDLLVVVVAFNISNAVVSWPIGALSDRIGRRALIATAWGIYALAYAGFALAGSPSTIAVLWLIYGVYYGVNDAVGKALVADLAPSERRATAFGVINAVVGFTLLPASLIAGILWDVDRAVGAVLVRRRLCVRGIGGPARGRAAAPDERRRACRLIEPDSFTHMT